MFSIGEFSKITSLPVKTLRFYHEQGVLEPTHVDVQTGYRYYAANKIETARIITQLRKLDFPLGDIVDILRCREEEEEGEDGDILAYFERHLQSMQEKVRHYREIDRTLQQIIAEQREAQVAMKTTSYEVEEKAIDSMLIAAVRIKGRYSDCGQGFSRIGRQFGRYLCGKPFLLHHDAEYKEEDADFEACMPIRQGTSKNGIEVRELAGGRGMALLHQGPYDELGRSYEKLLAHLKEQAFEFVMPTREVYLKGPGMIFKGNPRKYLTEIQMLVKE